MASSGQRSTKEVAWSYQERIQRYDKIQGLAQDQQKNISTSNHTKHVDICTKFVNEYVEDGIIKIIFVPSNNNDSDIMTKNVNGDLLDKHAGKLLMNKYELYVIIKCWGETPPLPDERALGHMSGYMVLLFKTDSYILNWDQKGRVLNNAWLIAEYNGNLSLSIFVLNVTTHSKIHYDS